jgi:hypothetical protein
MQSKVHRGLIRRYLQRVVGYSLPQLTRLNSLRLPSEFGQREFSPDVRLLKRRALARSRPGAGRQSNATLKPYRFVAAILPICASALWSDADGIMRLLVRTLVWGCSRSTPK